MEVLEEIQGDALGDSAWMFKFSRALGNPKELWSPPSRDGSCRSGVEAWPPYLYFGISAGSLPPSLFTLCLVRSDTGCKQVSNGR